VPKIHPFQGWRYNQDIITDIQNVISPPYDVITEEEQQQLYRQSPHNFVRLILNSTPGDKRYSDAAETLENWIGEKVIIRDDEPALYLMEQDFEIDGEPVKRTVIIATLELEELGKQILPHEQTIAKHIDDRYRLMESTLTNPGQIFMSYRDGSMVVESVAQEVHNAPPMINAKIDGHATYQIWKIQSTDKIQQIQKVLASSNAIIADGHHRYKTALQFKNNHPDIPGSDLVMVALVNAYNPGMMVLPTHRLIDDIEMEPKEIRSALEQIFDVEEQPSPDALMESLEKMSNGIPIPLGFYHRSSEMALLLLFRNEHLLQEVFQGTCPEYQSLDVNILHQFVLKQVFHIDTTEQDDLHRLNYIRGNRPVVEMLQDRNDYDVACFVNPPNLEDVFTIAESGLTLPQKTTYFFPKIYSGLIFRRFQ